jgi:hypothetical protein
MHVGKLDESFYDFIRTIHPPTYTRNSYFQILGQGYLKDGLEVLIKPTCMHLFQIFVYFSGGQGRS